MCLFAGTKKQFKENREAVITRMKKNGGKLTCYKVYTVASDGFTLVPPCYSNKAIEIKGDYITSDRRSVKPGDHEYSQTYCDVLIEEGIHVFLTRDGAKKYLSSCQNGKIFKVQGDVKDFVAISSDWRRAKQLVFKRVKPIDPEFKGYKFNSVVKWVNCPTKKNK